MPTKGHRKGIDNDAIPLTVLARTRLPQRLHDQIAADAARRRLTRSKLMRAIVAEYYDRQPVPRVKSHGPSDAVARELNRIGVNLNQLMHLANATRLVPVVEINQLLQRIEATLTKL